MLGNPQAAERFVNEVESAIEERSQNPEIFAVYAYSTDGKFPYYRILVGNYIILYVVLAENGEKIMEVRNIIYGRRNIFLLIFNGKI